MVFNAFKSMPYKSVRVVILSQDPYINGKVNGLAFSSQTNITPSLRIIFKELFDDVGVDYSQTKNPDLSHWARQGIFLLNTILIVEERRNLSYANKG